MALEITVQVTLVGEAELVHQFLKTLVCVHESHLELNYCVVVNNLLRILSACALAYCIEVTCGYLEHVGIILH